MKISPKSIESLRSAFSNPTMLGHKAWTLSDKAIVAYAEGFADAFVVATPKIVAAMKSVEAAFARLGHSLAKFNKAHGAAFKAAPKST